MVRKEEKRSQFHARGEQVDSNPNLEPIGEKQSFTNKNDDKKTNYGFNKAKRKFDDKLAIKFPFSLIKSIISLLIIIFICERLFLSNGFQVWITIH